MLPIKTLPPTQASEALVKAAPDSEPIAVPVDAVPNKDAMEKTPTDVPAAPYFPATPFAIFVDAPFLSRKIASDTSSQADAALKYQLLTETGSCFFL
jgi:hypothetical protein